MKVERRYESFLFGNLIYLTKDDLCRDEILNFYLRTITEVYLCSGLKTFGKFCCEIARILPAEAKMLGIRSRKYRKISRGMKGFFFNTRIPFFYVNVRLSRMSLP